MSSLNTFSRNGNIIYILREEWSQLAMTTYREDYFEELTSTTWTESKGYLVSSKLGSLHRYIMSKWYGEEMLIMMSERGWVVDHMNNDGFDCRISNLEFLLRRINVAKGQTVDVESEMLRKHIALTLCKDFTTGYYQIHIGCNDPIFLIDKTAKTKRPLAKLKLLYNCEYRYVILDAEKILLDYDSHQQIQIDSLHCVNWKAAFCELIPISEEEKNQAIIVRDGKAYYAPGHNTWLISSSVDEGWVPS